MIIDNNITDVLSKIRGNSTILTVTKYADNHNGLSDFQLIFNVSYKGVLERSIEKLMPVVPADEIEEKAKAALLESFRKSLAGENVSTSAHAYREVESGEGYFCKGCKWHYDKQQLHLQGYRMNKRIIVPSVYPPVKSAPLTIAKRKMKAKLPVARFRQFVLDIGRFEALKVEGTILTEYDVLHAPDDENGLDDGE